MSTEQAGAAQQASATQEAAGMSVDIVEKLQEKATVLTQERKRRGKTMPAELLRSSRYIHTKQIGLQMEKYR